MKRVFRYASIIIGLGAFFAVLAHPVFAAMTFSDTAISGGGAIGITAGAPSTWDVNGTLSLNTTSNGAITTGTGLLTAAGGVTISAGKNLTISSGTGSITTSMSPGGNTASLSLNSTVSGTIGYNDNFQSINNSLVFDPTGVDYAFSNVYGTYNYINVPASNSVNFSANSLLLIPSYNYVKNQSSGNAGEYLIGSWNKAEQAGSGTMHRTYGAWNEADMTNGTGQYLTGSVNQAVLSNGTTTSVVGVEAQNVLATWSGRTASTGSVYGVRSNSAVVTSGGTASATNVYDFYSQNSAPNAMGYPTSAFSFGVVQNYYGMYIEEHTHGVNNWNLYSVGGQNYFGGNVGIGTPIPARNRRSALERAPFPGVWNSWTAPAMGPSTI
jgi:hypothetical protein